MTALLPKLGETKAAALTLAGVFVFGFTTAAVVGGYVALPDQVEKNTRDLRAVEATLAGYAGKFDQLERELRLSNCLEITERSGTNWRECLDP